MVVPRGLRSFEREDADFFVDLLPGPRDRFGLPESLRFWKSKIEESDADNTFAVGLLYGPSGCGKSSLVKAGILPRLSEHIRVVYVEAGACDTEERLLRGLKRALPDLSPQSFLKEALSELRQGRCLRPDDKALLVVDQFEQWLHAHREIGRDELVAALRQCDGSRVQALILVRDDFWLAVSRFMRALEIDLLQGVNCALVDLFDASHAKRVLTAFGRAFGAIDAAKPTRESRDFVDRAVADLAADGKVVCVQLALFAEMMKARPWTPASLKAVGGAAGVGATYLEESLGSNAPAQHRQHATAARAVLQALLPESGDDIKGRMRSHSELVEVAGYSRRPADFDELLRILDRGLRLITATESNSAAVDLAEEPPSAPPAVGNASAVANYQLTHDFLVPALRGWLTCQLRETRAGRARIKLEECASLWNATPQNRFLPGPIEWARIRLFTRSGAWTPSQARMMKRADRMVGTRALASIAVIVVALGIGHAFLQRLQARTLRDALLSAQVDELPAIVGRMSSLRGWVDPLLRSAERQARSEGDAAALWRLDLALLASEPTRAAALVEHLYAAYPEELPVLSEALTSCGGDIRTSLQASLATPARTLRAAFALARLEPQSDHWRTSAGRVVDRLVEENPIHLGTWIAGLRPIRSALLPHLAAAFREKARPESERAIATTALADYASDDVAMLADLAMDAEKKALSILFPRLAVHGESARRELKRELARTAQPRWPLVALDRPKPAAELVKKLQASGGALDDGCAYCATLPTADLSTLVAGLSKAGYRPTRIRPYFAGNRVAVAAAWIRDGADFDLVVDATAAAMEKRHAANAAKSMDPQDLCVYRDGDHLRYAGVWVAHKTKGVDFAIAVGLGADRLRVRENELRMAGYWRDAIAFAAPSRGPESFIAIWSRPIGRRSPVESDSVDRAFDGPEHQYLVEYSLADVQMDVHIGPNSFPQSPAARFAALEAATAAALRRQPDDLRARAVRGDVRLYRREFAKAIEDYSFVLAKDPRESGARAGRILAFARSRRMAEARADLEKFANDAGDSSTAVYLAALVDGHDGKLDRATARLDAAAGVHAGHPGFLYDLACGHAVLSTLSNAKDVNWQEHRRQRAVELLRSAVARGYADFQQMAMDADMDPLRNRADFQAIRSQGRTDLRYVAVWHPQAGWESTELHGLDPSTHGNRAHSLMIEGWRPTGIAATAPTALSSTDRDIVMASAWRRPVVAELERELLAARQANAAAALLMLGDQESAWPLLAASADPRAKCRLLERLASPDIDPAFLAGRLETEGDVAIRRALILAMGTAGKAQQSGADHRARTGSGPPSRVDWELWALRLLEWHRRDADSGIHSATAWTLRQWGWGERLAAADAECAAADSSIVARGPGASSLGKRRWFVDSQVGAFAIVEPSEFLMGSPRDEIGREGGPEDRTEERHRRTIVRRFAIATCEVSVEQFKRFRPNHGSSRQFSHSEHCPVASVSWYDAAAYCNWLSERAGIAKDQWCYEPNAAGAYADGMKTRGNYLSLSGYRLPTEAEWECACRAGSGTARGFDEGEALIGRYARCFANAKSSGLAPVGSLRPNDLGLFDALGNVSEWVQNALGWYVPSLRGRPVVDNDAADVTRDSDLRVLRGGSFNSPPNNVRCAVRLRDRPDNRDYNLGFRLARSWN